MPSKPSIVQQRSPQNKSSLLYHCCRWIAWLLFRFFCRVHLVVLETPPTKGPCLIAANHISHFDPALLSGFFPRAIDWVAMKELFTHRVGASFFSALHAISINSFEKDIVHNRRSLRVILKRLSHKRVVGIFPEGGIRSHHESILEGALMKPGLASLSLISQAPIVPCVILGTDRLYSLKNWLTRPHLWIIIGKTITPPTPKKSRALKKNLEENLEENSESDLSFEEKLNAAFPALLQELRQRFQIQENDLPQTAQERRAA